MVGRKPALFILHRKSTRDYYPDQEAYSHPKCVNYVTLFLNYVIL